MTEAEFYELLGRKQVVLDNLNIEYDKLLTVLAQVIAGDVSHDRVSVDLAQRTWAVAAVPSEPIATVQ